MLHAPEFAPFPPARHRDPTIRSDAIGTLGPIGEAALESDDVDQSSLGVDGPSATGRTVDAAISVDDRCLAHDLRLGSGGVNRMAGLRVIGAQAMERTPI